MAKVLWVAGLLVAALVAGCTNDSASSKEPAPAAFDDVVVTSTTGAIRGVVVTQAIVPIAGALIVLPEGAQRTSDEEGAFVFNGLEPGDYFLTVSKIGYVTIQTSAHVVAGDAEPPITKVTLLPDAAAARPYYQEYVFDGFIQCSGTFVAVGAAVCSVTDIVGVPSEDRFGVTYPLEAKPSWMQTEMVWDSTQAAGNEMSVMYSWDCGDENDGFLCDHGAAGKSPILLVANATAIDEINEGDYNGTELFVRAFNEGLPESDPDVPGYGSAPGGGLGLTANQRFTFYTHLFFGYEPTEGWRFTSGEGVPQPPQ